MQVSVETTSSLGRKINITVPAETIDKKIESRLKELTKTVKMDGFRPGKVPVSAVKLRYGEAVREEIINKELQESLYKAFQDEKQHPAGTPHVDSIKAEKDKDLQYTASYEVYPEIQLADFTKVNIEQFKAEVIAEDVDKMLETIRKQHMDWKKVEREAKNEDKLVIDFKGFKDGETFEGGSAENVDLILGSKNFIPGFEEGLMGAKAGEEKTLELTFPEDYHAKDLAGKAVSFEVKVKSASEPQLPELNEEFAKKMGVEDGNVDTFRGQVKEHMQRELDNAINNRKKEQVFNQLLEQNKFDVPQALIEHEGQALIQRYTGQKQAPKEPQALPEPIKAEASRRVSIGLVLAEVIKQNEMKADQEKVRQHIENMAKTYQDPEQLVSWYYSNKEHLASIEAVVLEEQVVGKVLEQAAITEKAVSYDEVMNPKAEAKGDKAADTSKA